MEKTKMFGVMMGLAIMGLLIFSGPAASAINVELSDLNNKKIKMGDSVNVNATIDMDSLDRDIMNSTLIIKQGNALLKECVFDRDGNPISGCEGILINTENNWFGYGYEGSIHYNFIIDSFWLKTGAFDVYVITKSANEESISETEKFVVQSGNNRRDR